MAPTFSKRALALGGGGFTGYLFEIGALTALDDLFEDGVTMNDLDLYVGVSAGAAAASLLANGVRPQEILDTNLSGTRPYYFDHRNVFSPAIGEGLKTVWRVTRQLVPLLKLYVRHYGEMTFIDLLDKAQDALPSGIYTLEPFAKYLEAIFKVKGLSDRFAGLAKELYIPAIDLETGDGVLFGDEDWRDVPISRAVTASSAVPIYFCLLRDRRSKTRGLHDHDQSDGTRSADAVTASAAGRRQARKSIARQGLFVHRGTGLPHQFRRAFLASLGALPAGLSGEGSARHFAGGSRCTAVRTEFSELRRPDPSPSGRICGGDDAGTGSVGGPVRAVRAPWSGDVAGQVRGPRRAAPCAAR